MTDLRRSKRSREKQLSGSITPRRFRCPETFRRWKNKSRKRRNDNSSAGVAVCARPPRSLVIPLAQPTPLTTNRRTVVFFTVFWPSVFRVFSTIGRRLNNVHTACLVTRHNTVPRYAVKRWWRFGHITKSLDRQSERWRRKFVIYVQINARVYFFGTYTHMYNIINYSNSIRCGR